MTKEQIKEYSLRISQANKTQLVVISYDMSMLYLESAVKLYMDGKIPEYRNEVKHAKAIINELSSSLNMKYEIAGELFRIYMFISNFLLKAIIRDDVTDMDRIIAMIKQLRDSYDAISSMDTSGPVMENTQQVYAGLTYSGAALTESMYSESNRGFSV